MIRLGRVGLESAPPTITTERLQACADAVAKAEAELAARKREYRDAILDYLQNERRPQ